MTRPVASHLCVVALLVIAASIPDLQGQAPGPPDTVHVDWRRIGPGNGTPEAPFNTIAAAVDRVADGGTVSIASGLYDETLVLARPMTLVAADASVLVGVALPPPLSVSIDPARMELDFGSSARLTAIAVYPGPEQRDVTLRSDWSSSNPGVAQVGNDPETKGIISALSRGTARIQALIDGVSAHADITILGPARECEGAGAWSGVTSQGQPVSLRILESNCHLTELTITTAFGPETCFLLTIRGAGSIEIIDESFDVLLEDPEWVVRVTGQFDSEAHAWRGTFQAIQNAVLPRPCEDRSDGSWIAHQP